MIVLPAKKKMDPKTGETIDGKPCAGYPCSPFHICKNHILVTLANIDKIKWVGPGARGDRKCSICGWEGHDKRKCPEREKQ